MKKKNEYHKIKKIKKKIRKKKKKEKKKKEKRKKLKIKKKWQGSATVAHLSVVWYNKV